MIFKINVMTLAGVPNYILITISQKQAERKRKRKCAKPQIALHIQTVFYIL